jgi:hypothetical protein
MRHNDRRAPPAPEIVEVAAGEHVDAGQLDAAMAELLLEIVEAAPPPPAPDCPAAPRKK